MHKRFHGYTASLKAWMIYLSICSIFNFPFKHYLGVLQKFEQTWYFRNPTWQKYSCKGFCKSYLHTVRYPQEIYARQPYQTVCPRLLQSQDKEWTHPLKRLVHTSTRQGRKKEQQILPVSLDQTKLKIHFI